MTEGLPSRIEDTGRKTCRRRQAQRRSTIYDARDDSH
jgi:hypothetical protein